MDDLQWLRRAGGSALRTLADLLPLDPERGGHADVSILFLDVEGSSAFVAESGDQAAVAVLGVLEHVAASAMVGRRGVRIVKRLGDGLMIVARRPEDALRVAVSSVREFGDEMRELAWPLRLRAGVHRGMVVRQADDFLGYHVNVAARVVDAAFGGQALTTAHALAGVDLGAHGLSARPAGTLQAKGVTGTVALFDVSDAPRSDDNVVPLPARSLQRPTAGAA